MSILESYRSAACEQIAGLENVAVDSTHSYHFVLRDYFYYYC